MGSPAEGKTTTARIKHDLGARTLLVEVEPSAARAQLIFETVNPTAI